MNCCGRRLPKGRTAAKKRKANRKAPPVTTAAAMNRERRQPGGAFAALTSRGFRIYLSGQSLANTGSWMQRIAQDWLIFSLTRSSTAVGVTIALQFLPMLLLGLHAGAVADRLPAKAHPAHHPAVQRRCHPGAGGDHHLRCRAPRRRLHVRAARRGDLRLRRAGQAGVRDRGGPAGPTARRGLAQRRRLPGDPADRAGHREPADRHRGDRRCSP